MLDEFLKIDDITEDRYRTLRHFDLHRSVMEEIKKANNSDEDDEDNYYLYNDPIYITSIDNIPHYYTKTKAETYQRLEKIISEANADSDCKFKLTKLSPYEFKFERILNFGLFTWTFETNHIVINKVTKICKCLDK